jgi:hypothetical protein
MNKRRSANGARSACGTGAEKRESAAVEAGPQSPLPGRALWTPSSVFRQMNEGFGAYCYVALRFVFRFLSIDR